MKTWLFILVVLEASLQAQAQTEELSPADASIKSEDVDWSEVSEDDDNDWHEAVTRPYGLAVSAGPITRVGSLAPFQAPVGFEAYMAVDDANQITVTGYEGHAKATNTGDNGSFKIKKFTSLEQVAVVAWRHLLQPSMPHSLYVTGGIEVNRSHLTFKDNNGEQPYSGSPADQPVDNRYVYNATTLGFYAALGSMWQMPHGLFLAMDWVQVYTPLQTLHAQQTAQPSSHACCLIKSYEQPIHPTLALFKLAAGYSF